MKTLISEKVYHKKYGAGVIIEETNKRVCIKFDQTEEKKQFLCPNSFEQYLKLQDNDLQKVYYELAVELREESERIIKEQREVERQKELDFIAEEKEKKKISRRKTAKAVLKSKN